MDATEVIVREVKREGRMQILSLLRESVGQSCQATHGHPDGKVLSLDM
jgi:hypothetical protein